MTFNNSNFWHNAINLAGIIIGIVGGILTYTGCTFDQVAQKYDCTTSYLPAEWLPLILGGLFVLKGIINITRDGLGGLVKVQPPVADAVTTVVQPVNVSKDAAAKAPEVTVKTNFKK